MAHQDLCEMTVEQLKALCRSRNLSGYSRLRKAELVEFLQQRLGEELGNAPEEAAAGNEEAAAGETPDIADENLAAANDKTPDVESALPLAPSAPDMGKDVALSSSLHFLEHGLSSSLIICDRSSALLSAGVQQPRMAIGSGVLPPNLSQRPAPSGTGGSELAIRAQKPQFLAPNQRIKNESHGYQDCIKSLLNPHSNSIALRLKQNLPNFQGRLESNQPWNMPKARPASVSRERSPPAQGL